MGVQNCDWWREHYRERRRREATQDCIASTSGARPRPLAAPWFACRTVAWAAVMPSAIVLAANSNPG